MKSRHMIIVKRYLFYEQSSVSEMSCVPCFLLIIICVCMLKEEGGERHGSFCQGNVC